MKIIIIGCGRVGYALAERLVQEEHEVTIVESEASRLQDAADELDIMGIVGNGCSIATLNEAGVSEADLLIAVTDSDEVNLLCCLIGKNSGNCQTVARVRNPIYEAEVESFKKTLGISMVINPEMIAAKEIARILQFPLANSMSSFAKGRVELLRFRLKPEYKLGGMTIANIGRQGAGQMLVVGVEREKDAYIPNGDFVLQDGDLVSVIATPKNLAAFFGKIGVKTNQIKSCMIAGGGTTSVYLARQLMEMKIRVVIIEQDPAVCQELAEVLPDAVIVQGDGTNKRLLHEENIDHVESFVSLLDIDEENILLSLYVKESVKAKVVTMVDRTNYDNLLEKLRVGSVVYPKALTADSILRFCRATQNSIGSNVETLYHILDNKAEAVEFIIRENCPVVNVPIKDLKLKSNLLIGCISRGDEVRIPNGSDCLKVGDSVVIVTTQKQLRDIQDILAR